MKLLDLNPKWLIPNRLFVFLCPHCKKDWLAVSVGFVKCQDQFDAYEREFGEDWNLLVIPAPEKSPWTISNSDFAVMSIRPSVDASRSGSGHWHGFVTEGAIE